MLFGEKQTKRSAVEKEVKKIIKGIMKSYEKEEMGEVEEAFFEQIDSLRIIELIVLTEKKFKIEIPTEQLAQLNDQKLDTFIDLILQTMKGDVNDGSETNPTASSVLLSEHESAEKSFGRKNRGGILSDTFAGRFKSDGYHICACAFLQFQMCFLRI